MGEEKKTPMDMIRDAKDMVDSLQERYLTTTGWHHTCDFPDSRWRWVRQIGERTLATSRDEACAIQERFEEIDEAGEFA